MKSFANLSSMVILSAFLAGCATPSVQTPAASTDPATRLATMMSGRYQNANMANPLHDHRIRIDPMGSGQWVYYQVNEGADLDQIYRQRVLVLRSRSDGRVVQSAYALTAPGRYQGMGDSLSTLTLDQLKPEMDKGCDMIWIEMPERWLGQVDPNRCMIIAPTQQAELRRGVRTDLNSTRLRIAETGYDLDGNRLWGSEDGEWTVLHRIP